MGALPDSQIQVIDMSFLLSCHLPMTKRMWGLFSLRSPKHLNLTIYFSVHEISTLASTPISPLWFEGQMSCLSLLSVHSRLLSIIGDCSISSWCLGCSLPSPILGIYDKELTPFIFYFMFIFLLAFFWVMPSLKEQIKKCYNWINKANIRRIS